MSISPRSLPKAYITQRDQTHKVLRTEISFPLYRVSTMNIRILSAVVGIFGQHPTTTKTTREEGPIDDVDFSDFN